MSDNTQDSVSSSLDTVIVSAEADNLLFKYDPEEHARLVSQKPWAPTHFKHVKISCKALIKMTMHAHQGGDLEIMGILLGTITEDGIMIVSDSFELPGHGTHTRVNPEAEHYEFLVDYMETCKKVGRLENAMGWYHSHPGYGCWLSGIDCATQLLNQQHQDPWLAIVIDPKRTISSGKVEIGAFRTYPEGHKPTKSSTSSTDYQPIPLDKIEDFGVHHDSYYSLPISYFKSTVDSMILKQLGKKCWVSTLSSSSMITNRDYVSGQINDIAMKVHQAEAQAEQYFKSFEHRSRASKIHPQHMLTEDNNEDGKDLKKPNKLTIEGSNIAIEQLQGLQLELIKEELFNKAWKC